MADEKPKKKGKPEAAEGALVQHTEHERGPAALALPAPGAADAERLRALSDLDFARFAEPYGRGGMLANVGGVEPWREVIRAEITRRSAAAVQRAEIERASLAALAKIEHYRVVAESRVSLPGQQVVLCEGQVVSEHTHDLGELRRQGVALVPCEALRAPAVTDRDQGYVAAPRGFDEMSEPVGGS
jgi:hypothetical protein